MLVVFRIGAYIPIPFVNAQVLAEAATQFGQGALGLVDMFSGGALQNCALFGLGIMPYISASIVMQLLATVIKPLEELQREGEAGMRKINQYTRYATVLLCVVQGLFLARMIMNLRTQEGVYVIPLEAQGIGFIVSTIIALTTGTMLLMWVGEQIQEHGVGNGISILIMAGIVARIPPTLMQLWHAQVDRANLMAPAEDKIGILGLVAMVLMYVGVVAGVVMLNQGQRRITIQTAKQIRGRRVFGGNRYYLPLKVGMAGVIPIIFAQSLLMFPQMILGRVLRYAPDRSVWGWVVQKLYGLFALDSFSYIVIYVMLIMFFCFFWTAVQFNPIKMADEMKEHGNFIPGIRPGKRTSEYFERVMTRITLAGSVFLAVIAIIPYMVQRTMHIDLRVAYIYGGTGILIVVGVALDLVQKIENHLLMRHYEGFLKSGTRIRGRQG